METINGEKARGIYKRGSTYWIRYADVDGSIKFESAKTNKIEKAVGLLAQRKKGVEEGIEAPKKIKSYYFIELAEKYTAWMQGRHESADSKAYRINQLKAYFGILPLRKFTTLLLTEYQTSLINKKLAPASVNKNISILKAMIKMAVQWDMAPEITLKNVLKVKQLEENNARLRYLEDAAECQKLIDACDKHLKPIVITALNSGMRRGEILSLRWDKNIDLKNGLILLEKTKTKRRREIPINKTLRETLESLYHGTKETPRRIDVLWVFHDNGRPYKSVKRSFNSALRKANIRDFVFHDLRHCFASHLIMAGIDITTVSKLLGHQNIKMTLRYAHLAPAHLAKAVDVLDSVINGKKESTIQKVYKQATLQNFTSPNPLKSMVGGTGIEPVTSAL